MAVVTILDASGDPHGTPRHGTRIAEPAGADGRFAVSFRPDDREHYLVRVTAPGAFPKIAELSRLRPDESVDLGDVALAPGGTVRCRVVPPAGAATAGTYIGLFTQDAWIESRATPATGCRLSDAVGADGEFLLGPLPPGRHRLVLFSPLWQFAAATDAVVAAGAETDLGVVFLVPKPGWHGLVRTAAGEPVVGAWVEAEPVDAEEGKVMPASARSDVLGRFALLAPDADRRPARIRVRSMAKGLPDAVSGPVAMGETLLLQHPAGRTARLRVSCATTGSAILRGTVQRLAASGAFRQDAEPFAADASGVVAVAGLGSDVDALVVGAEGYAQTRTPTLAQLGPGPVTLRLAPLGSVRVSVRDPAGAAAVGLLTEVTGPIPAQAHRAPLPDAATDQGSPAFGLGQVLGRARTATDGVAVVPRVMPGTVWVRSLGDGGPPFLSGPHELLPGETLAVSVVLPEHAEVHGNLAPLAAVAAGMSIRLCGLDEAWTLPAAVAADGSFVVKHVPCGRWRVELHDPEATYALWTDRASMQWTRSVLGEIVVGTEGVTRAFDLSDRQPADCSGSLRVDGAAVAGAEVALCRVGAVGDEASRVARTNARGEWQIRGVRSGAWRALCRVQVDGALLVGASAEPHLVRPAGMPILDLDLKLRTIRVRCLRPDGSAHAGVPLRLVSEFAPQAARTPLLTTDAAGCFRFQALLPGAWRVESPSGRTLFRWTSEELDSTASMTVRW